MEEAPSIASLMALASMLFVKHLIADGPLQTAHQVANKGKFLHPAGLTHAGVHAGLTAACLAIWTTLGGDRLGASLFALILVLEFVVHYAADWAKCQIDARFNWSSRVASSSGEMLLQINSSMFFYAFLADQTVHSLTYLGVVYLVAVGW